MELRPRPLFKIEYYQDKGRKLVETIGFNGTQQPMTRTQLRLKLDELRRTTHKTGILVTKQTNKEECKPKAILIWNHPVYPESFSKAKPQ